MTTMSDGKAPTKDNRQMSQQNRDQESIDGLLIGKRIRRMRTDWLVLEKERLERKNATGMPDTMVDVDLEVIKAELSNRGEPSEQPDFDVTDILSEKHH